MDLLDRNYSRTANKKERKHNKGIIDRDDASEVAGGLGAMVGVVVSPGSIIPMGAMVGVSSMVGGGMRIPPMTCPMPLVATALGKTMGTPSTITIPASLVVTFRVTPNALWYVGRMCETMSFGGSIIY